MGIRGEIYTTKVFTEDGSRTFFFNIKENRFGDYFLNIVESSKRDNDQFKRFSIIVFEEDMKAFFSLFDHVIERFRKDETDINEVLKTGSGKRVYTLNMTRNRAGFSFLEIIEQKDRGLTDSFKERIRIGSDSIEDFLKGYDLMISFLKGKGKL